MGSNKDKKHKDSKEKKRKRDRDRDEAEERRRAEKLAKKVAKQLKKDGGSVAGYTDEENPFGDTNLSGKFVWNKKLEKQIHEGADIRELGSEAERHRQEERLAEIAKVKQRRQEREEEKARMEEELAVMERQRALADAHILEQKEEEFHLEQARVRADIRLREGRAKPVDMLAKNLHVSDDFAFGLPYPYHIFDNLSLEEMKDLKTDIHSYQELDMQDDEHKEFWACLMVVAETQLQEAERRDTVDRAHLRGEPVPEEVAQEAGLHASIEKDLEGLMADKSHGELLELDEGITAQLESGECADPEYWDAVRRRLKVHLARARLRDIHHTLQEKHRQRREAGIPKMMGWDGAGGEEGETAGNEEGAREEGAEEEDRRRMPPPPPPGEEQRLSYERLTFDPATMSPPTFTEEECAGLEVLNEDGDEQLLLQLRAQVEYHASGKFRAARDMMPSSSHSEADTIYQRMLKPGSGPSGVPIMLRHLSSSDNEPTFRSGKEPQLDEDEAKATRMAASVSRMMGEDAGEVQFSVEANLSSQVYWWHDKYRPRKPKYFNRVHTGYEWNKYNQTHYDHDNPPPKVVQGYKFNIFYPDLIDKQKAPIYKLEKDPSSDDGQTCVLRFSAGPPYEDIAFKIVNKEWEYAHKKGFKCSFERGIMHLYFNFKRARYRR